MKIFDWVHRKFQQNCRETTTKQHKIGDDDRTSHASLMDLLACDQLSPAKPNLLKVVQGNLNGNYGQPLKRNAVEQYFYSEEKKGDRSVQALLVRDNEHGFLAIGTLGISNLHSNLEEVDVVEDKDVKVGSLVDQVPVDIEEFRMELERVLYNRSSEVVPEKRNEEQNHSNESQTVERSAAVNEVMGSRKSKAGRKVFPLRDFLEVPQTPSEAPAATSQKKKMGGLSNFFIAEKRIHTYEKTIHENKREMADQKSKSVPSALKRAMMRKSKPGDSDSTPPYKPAATREKVLRAFLKKLRSTRSSDNNKLSKKDEETAMREYVDVLLKGSKSNGPICNGIVDASHGIKEQQARVDQIYNKTNNTNNNTFNGLVEAFKFDIEERCSNGQDEHTCCWPRWKDASLGTNLSTNTRTDEFENGYWIKTDEEYLVLEL